MKQPLTQIKTNLKNILENENITKKEANKGSVIVILDKTL